MAVAQQEDLRSLDTHFEFGANWADYSRHIDEHAITKAKEGLLRLFTVEELRGADFLDIGCGSGIHALAAVQLGVDRIVGVDIDPNSVETTRKTLTRFAPDARAEVRHLSVFDAEPSDLGQFDIVYSWGVLHHTGDMWTAIERAGHLVKPGGLFALALYQKRPLCGAWTVEKRVYTRGGEPLRKAIRGIYIAAYMLGLIATGRNPVRYVQNYSTSRGMNFFNDVHDWLGGYPYESATPDEVTARLSDFGFEMARSLPLGSGLGVFGTGCAEYVLRRRS